MATFAGTGYYGAGAGATVDASGKRYLHTTERVSPLKRQQRIYESKHPKGSEVITGRAVRETMGDVETDETDDADSYLVVRNKKKEEEKRKEEEEEEAQKKAEESKKKEEENKKFQDSRDQHQQEKAPGQMKSEAKNRTGENELADGKDHSERAKDGKGDGGDDRGKEKGKK